MENGLEWISLGLSIIPGIGEVKSALEFISGKDLITQKDLKEFDKACCLISAIPIAGRMAKISKFSKTLRYAKKFENLFKQTDSASKASTFISKYYFAKQILEDSGCTCGEFQFRNDPNSLVSKIFQQENTLSTPAYNLFLQIAGKYFLEQQKQKKSIGELATEVIRGNWGVGNERKRRLEEAGYNYQEVQNEVNRKLRKKIITYFK